MASCVISGQWACSGDRASVFCMVTTALTCLTLSNPLTALWGRYDLLIVQMRTQVWEVDLGKFTKLGVTGRVELEINKTCPVLGPSS